MIKHDVILLQVGDVVYGKDNYGFKSMHKIERVTKTLAISGNLKLNRASASFKKYVSIGHKYSFNSIYYYLETEEVKIEYRHYKITNQLNNKLSSIDFRKVKYEDLMDIYNILIKYDKNEKAL